MSKKLVTATETAIAAIEKQELEDMKARIGTIPSNKINTQNKIFRLPDGKENKGPMKIVIVDFIYCNDYYESAWDANNPQGAACFGRTYTEATMIPSINSEEKQAEDCNSCPMNVFGSSGKGKACKNTIKLAVLPVDMPDESIMTLNISPTALKNFKEFASEVSNKFSALPRKVVTEVSFDPAVAYAKLQFKPVELNPNYAEHTARLLDARAILEAEPLLQIKEGASNESTSSTTAGSRRRSS